MEYEGIPRTQSRLSCLRCGQVGILLAPTTTHRGIMTTVYAICLVFGLIFTLFSAVAGHFFGGHDGVGTDGQADAGFSSDGIPGISFFSPTVLASFMTAFGAFGLIFCQIGATSSVWINAPISFVGGLG